MSTITRYKVQVGQQLIPYYAAGEGEPLMLIHGLSGSSRWWVRNIDVLAKSYRLYLLDLPGFGIMRHPHQRFVLDKVAADVVAWMEAMNLLQVHILGHSMGGYISLWIAAHYPRLIKRMVLAAPAGVPHIRTLRGYTFPILKALHFMRPGFFSILLTDALRAGPMTILRAAQDLLTKDIQSCLRDITAPTLLIWGENDTLVPPALGEVLKQSIQDARLLLLKRAGHVPMFDQPEQFNAATLAFLAGQADENARLEAFVEEAEQRILSPKSPVIQACADLPSSFLDER